MIALQVTISMLSMVIQNCLFNTSCKKELPTNNHLFRFNIVMYAICIIVFGATIFIGGISLYTVLIGLVFGVVLALSNLYKMMALSNGPMHITILITTSSMIIPTMSGIFFGESFSLPKLLFVAILIWFIYLSLGKSSDKKINKRWLLFSSLAFVFQGTVGVLQKIHQTSSHKGEANALLFVAFTCSLIYNRIRAKKTFAELNFTKKHIIFALICGACAYTMNVLNLRLSGLLPSQLFFPLVNGSSIVLTSLISVLFFKERITKTQAVGLIGGILSLIAICIVK